MSSCQLCGVILISRKKKSKTSECNLSKASISRVGRSVRNFKTLDLIKHLQKYHGKEYAKFIQARSAKKKSVSLATTNFAGNNSEV